MQWLWTAEVVPDAFTVCKAAIFACWSVVEPVCQESPETTLLVKHSRHGERQ